MISAYSTVVHCFSDSNSYDSIYGLDLRPYSSQVLALKSRFLCLFVPHLANYYATKKVSDRQISPCVFSRHTISLVVSHFTPRSCLIQLGANERCVFLVGCRRVSSAEQLQTGCKRRQQQNKHNVLVLKSHIYVFTKGSLLGGLSTKSFLTIEDSFNSLITFTFGSRSFLCSSENQALKQIQ